MPRVASLTFVPNAAAGTAFLPLSEIPAEVKQEVEEAYKLLKDNDGNLQVGYSTKAELAVYERQVRSYCAQRPAELGGPIRFRRSPVRGLPETHMAFRITDPTSEEEEKERKNKAVEKAAKKAAKANGKK